MDAPPQTSVLRWHVIMPEGTYSDDSVLGVAVDASTIALFSDSIDDATSIFNPRISAEDIENSVMVHEFGHLLGLVNLVYTSPADHEDSDTGHSNNEDSVMYWAVETVTISAWFSGDLPTQFDQDDLNDLAGMKAVNSQQLINCGDLSVNVLEKQSLLHLSMHRRLTKAKVVRTKRWSKQVESAEASNQMHADAFD